MEVLWTAGHRAAGRRGRATIDPMEPPEPLTFACPRCHTEVSEPDYGPCPACRQQLRATLGTAPRQVEVAEYEPKVNVTPNAVATKD